MTTKPFHLILADLCASPLRPLNLEHVQARLAHVHDACVQILYDSEGYSTVALFNFPTLRNIAALNHEQIAAWWDDFSVWLRSLTPDEYFRLNAEEVIST